MSLAEGVNKYSNIQVRICCNIPKVINVKETMESVAFFVLTRHLKLYTFRENLMIVF